MSPVGKGQMTSTLSPIISNNDDDDPSTWSKSKKKRMRRKRKREEAAKKLAMDGEEATKPDVSSSKKHRASEDDDDSNDGKKTQKLKRSKQSSPKETMITLAQTLSKDVEDKLIAVDIDGTLCHHAKWYDGVEPEPRQEIIDLVWKWYKARAHIIIYTSRQPKYYPLTLAWLIKHDVPFHGICMQQKPSADYYIDDKNLCVLS